MLVIYCLYNERLDTCSNTLIDIDFFIPESQIKQLVWWAVLYFFPRLPPWDH